MSDRDVVIVGAARTPIGSFGGALREATIPALAAVAIRSTMERAGLAGVDVDELVLGVNFPGSDRSIARQAALRGGLPEDGVAYTVDRACCSSLAALALTARGIRSGESDVALAGGAENLSAVPFFIDGMRWGHRLGSIQLGDQLVITCPHTGVPRAVQAADEAARYGVGRAEQDRWALRSQQRCARAVERGLFDVEITPVRSPADAARPYSLGADESPRRDTTLERLAALPTVHGSATVTAGNAPGLSTGAAMLAVAAAGVARERGLRPLATVLGVASVSGPPAQIASIPAVAAQRVLDRCGVDLADVDLIEINEAFAAVPLVTTLRLAGGDADRAAELRERTNVNGGAVALGHPTGATGARLVMTVVAELRRRGGGIGLVTMCGGIGEANAVLVRAHPDGEVK
ncbi:acetyl-CoA C-acetyltransferase [Dactylosporangium fulvum]|uniref:Probable acetyl-CoA acetyltransferase n=1 Tax=Dactylosporangium fulvum TaxID=53359 RepID=A0ABY5WBZ8_9ACTN|nr:thiolase family protein [Dactylosporangium fulvum]UWP85616.1 thiolase family protein [Dactylosporangium fulvum]